MIVFSSFLNSIYPKWLHFFLIISLYSATSLYSILVSANQASTGVFVIAEREGQVNQNNANLTLNFGNSSQNLEFEKGSSLSIVEDGLRIYQPKKGLDIIYPIKSLEDTAWSILKSNVESLRDARYFNSIEENEIPLYAQLAFAARLDENAKSSFEFLKNQGVEFKNSRILNWNYKNNNGHKKVINALKLIIDSLKNKTYKIADSANTIAMGFPNSLTPKKLLYWPTNMHENLYLAPNSYAGRYSNGKVDGRLILGKPTWFVNPPDYKQSFNEEVACVPFKGCGWIKSSSIQDVEPLWIEFDKKSRKPVRVFVY